MAKNSRQLLSTLADEVSGLEEIASRIQEVESDEEANSIARTLGNAYAEWLARALVILPSDMLSAFEFEYKGDFFRSRIKKFIEEPRAPAMEFPDMPENFKATMSPWLHPYSGSFRGPLMTQKQILLNSHARLGIASETIEALDLLEGVTRNLPYSIELLKREHKSGSLSFSDEYDLQRLLHAVLHLSFADVRPEDFTPSRGGANSRIDFILPEVRIAVEAKMTRDGLAARRLGEELAVDILRYQAHPDAAALFAIIYDPSRRVSNPVGFERDLLSNSDDFPVRVVVFH
jgi:REase_DpnII-MboI